MNFPTIPGAQIPHLDVNTDTGPFVYAVAQMPPGKIYIAESGRPTWPEYLRTWSKIVGQPTKYQEVTLEQFIGMTPDKPFGREAGDMFLYSSSPGYDGGDSLTLKAADIEKVSWTFGLHFPMNVANLCFVVWNRVPNDQPGGLHEKTGLGYCSWTVRTQRDLKTSTHEL